MANERNELGESMSTELAAQEGPGTSRREFLRTALAAGAGAAALSVFAHGTEAAAAVPFLAITGGYDMEQNANQIKLNITQQNGNSFSGTTSDPAPPYELHCPRPSRLAHRAQQAGQGALFEFQEV